jgi:hypothetical protein
MDRRRVASTMSAMVVIGVLAAACTAGAGSAQPSATTTPTTTPGIGPAPVIQHPLNPAGMIAAPAPL